MAFGAKIKLTVDRSSAAQSEFRSAIQSMVDSATSKSPIKVKNISFELDASKIAGVISDLQKSFDNAGVTIKVQKIDAASAIADLKTQLANAVTTTGGGGSGKSGLLSVKADDIVDSKRIAAAAAKATAAFNTALTAAGNNFSNNLVQEAERALTEYSAAAKDASDEHARLLEESLKFSSQAKALAEVQKSVSGVTSEVSRLGAVWNQLNSIMKKSDLFSSDDSKKAVQSGVGELLKEWKSVSEVLVKEGSSDQLTSRIDSLIGDTSTLKAKSDQLAKIEKDATNAASALSRLNNIKNQINSIFNGANLLRSTESTTEIQTIAERLKREWQGVAESVAANSLDTTASKENIDELAQSVIGLKERFEAVKVAESQTSNIGSTVGRLNDSLQLLSNTEKSINNISDEQKKNYLLEQRRQIYEQINSAITKTETYKEGSTIATGLRQNASLVTLDTYLQLVDQYKSTLSSLNTENLPYADDRQKTVLADCVGLQERLNSLKDNQAILSARESDNLRNDVASLANKVTEQQQYVTLSNEAATLSKKIYDYLATNPNVTNKMGANFTSIIDSVSGANITAEAVKNAAKEFDNLRASAKLAGLEGKGMWQKLGDAGSILTTWISARKIITTIISQIKKMIENVKDLDAAMTELKKVTDLTATSYNKFFNTAVSVAKEVGATVSDTINATADFARLGYNVSDATQLAQAALIYKNVGDGINDVSEASESLISTMKAFGIAAEDSMEIVDRFNEVGRFCPIT